MKARTKLLTSLNQNVTSEKMQQAIFTFFFLGVCMIAVAGMQIPPSADVTSARLTPQPKQQEITATKANDVMSDDFCTGLSEGSYCQNCMMPITCDADGAPIEYGPCPVGQACIVDHGTSYCTEHTATACACPSPGNQCDAYNPSYVEHCGATGPFQVTLCDTGMTCYQGECHALTECTVNEWNLVKPKCSSSVYCDETGILSEISCLESYYVDSNLDCSPAPPPDCDGTCGGKCPNPIDCSKYVICDGTTATGKGDCLNGMLFDIVTKNCIAKENNPTCVATDNCEFTTTHENNSNNTNTTPIPTTNTTSPTTTAIPAQPCDELHAGDKYSATTCSQWYWTCVDFGHGDYQWLKNRCLDDLYFDDDVSNPYCVELDTIETCTWQ